MVKIVNCSAQLLNYLVSDITDLLKLKYGRLPINENTVNPKDIVLEVFEIFSI